MTINPDAFAAAAEALVGTPFRLHGRDPRTGLDCIGVFAAALKACGQDADLPVGYRMRMVSLEEWLPSPSEFGFRVAEGPALAGDVVLQRVGPVQYHLAIALGSSGWVHAHAGLRRVVKTPARPDGPIIEQWRPVAPT